MNIKRLVLGTAAGALAVTGAQAADLPVVVEPVDYVRICDAFGVGFFYIPGTETCLRVSGRIRADYNVYFDDEDLDILGGLGYEEDGDNGYRFRARAYIYMDSRTNTEFGLLRAFTEVYFTSDFGNSNPSTTLNRAFIQFGGLTFGRTQSFYDFLDTYYTAGQTFGPAGISDTTTNLIAYTFAFGNGFSASVSLEDESQRRNGWINVSNALQDEYQGTRIPDIVGNIRVDQGWGSAQIMAAGHYTESFDNQNAIRYSEEDYGFALGAGVSVNVPFGNGTEVGLQGHYAHGATKYTGLAVEDYVLRGTGATGISLDAIDAWAIQGGFSTNFTPTISLAASASYGYAEADLGFTDLDYNQVDLQGFLGYSPVSGFTLGVGAEYRYVDLYDSDIDSSVDGSAFTVFFRAQRTY